MRIVRNGVPLRASLRVYLANTVILLMFHAMVTKRCRTYILLAFKHNGR